MRRWRLSRPLYALFKNHVHNATRRGKLVAWDFEEFQLWCEFTGHHLLSKDGYEIHRFGDKGPYCADNCMSLKGDFNKRLEAGFRWRRKWLAERLHFMQVMSA